MYIIKMTSKKIIDSIYDATIVVGLTIAFAHAGKHFLGLTRPGAKIDMDDRLKLTGCMW